MRLLTSILLVIFAGCGALSAGTAGAGKEIYRSATSGQEKLKLYLDSSKFYAGKSPQKGEYFADEALTIAKRIGDRAGEARALFYLAASDENAYDYAKSILNYVKALGIFEELNDREFICKCCISIGGCYNCLSDYSKALPYLNKALALARYNEYDKLIDIYNGISYSYVMLGDYSMAIDYSLKSLSAAETQGDRRRTAYLLNNLSNIYLNWKDYDQALAYLGRALKIAEEIKNESVKETVMSSLSEVYSEKGMMNEAIYYGNRALKIATSMNDSVEIGRCYYYLSVYYDRIGQTLNSLDLKLKYLKLLERIGNKSGQINDLYSIGEIYYKTGDFANARTYFTRSLALAREIKYLRFISKSYLSLSETLFALGDYKQAYQYLTNYIQASDSLFNEESKKKLQTLQIKYETEKKEKENADLKDRNLIQLRYFIIILALALLLLALLLNRYISRKKSLNLISRKNAQIEEANAELKTMNERITEQNAELEDLNKELVEVNASKDKFFLILSHELLNPIRWLSNVANLLIDKLDKMSKAELRGTVELLGVSAKESNLLLEKLLLWAKIHTDRIIFAPEELCLSSLINDNVDLVKARLQEKQITVEVAAASGEHVFADKVMLETIMRNLLNNAIKFSNPGGFIKITSQRNNGFIDVSVMDIGVGIRPENKDKLFRLDVHYTTLGTSKEKGAGLGLILCKEYLEKTGGSIRVESEYNKGSTFTFSIPAR
ncbi:MAG: tetratricopeptide repeat protein [Chloroflexota bacterium]